VVTGHSTQTAFSEPGHPGILRTRIAAAAAANTFHLWGMGVTGATNNFYLQDVARAGLRFRVSDLTGISLAVGMGNGTPSAGGTGFTGNMYQALNASDSLAIIWDPTTQGTVECVTRDSPSNQTITTTGASLASDTWYDFEWGYAGGVLSFWLNGTLLAAHGTDLPANPLVAKAMFRAHATHGSVRDVDCDLYHLEYAN